MTLGPTRDDPAHPLGGDIAVHGQPPGVKLDTDKQRWDLLQWKALEQALEQVVAVMTFGARKYTPNGWREVEGWRWRYHAALMRHLAAWALGERVDPESGLPHLAHVAWNALTLCELDATDAGTITDFFAKHRKEVEGMAPDLTNPENARVRALARRIREAEAKLKSASVVQVRSLSGFDFGGPAVSPESIAACSSTETCERYINALLMVAA